VRTKIHLLTVCVVSMKSGSGPGPWPDWKCISGQIRPQLDLKKQIRCNPTYRHYRPNISWWRFGPSVVSGATTVRVVGLWTRKKFCLGVRHPKILVYLVTCSWCSSSVNHFNTAVTAHQRPIFLIRMGSCPLIHPN